MTTVAPKMTFQATSPGNEERHADTKIGDTNPAPAAIVLPWVINKDKGGMWLYIGV
jgi:hypothetical protein